VINSFYFALNLFWKGKALKVVVLTFCMKVTFKIFIWMMIKITFILFLIL